MPKAIKKPIAKKPIEAKRKRGRPKKTGATKISVAAPVEEKVKLKRLSYLFAVGRRKTAVARVRYYKKGEGKYTVNGQTIEKHFATLELQNLALAPLQVLPNKLEGDISVKVTGGGLRGQADSVRHGLARILVLLDQKNRPQLKRLGFLSRDARVKERKKYGLKRARRAPQWQKR